MSTTRTHFRSMNALMCHSSPKRVSVSQQLEEEPQCYSTMSSNFLTKVLVAWFGALDVTTTHNHHYS